MHTFLLHLLAVTYGTNAYDTSTYGGSGATAAAGAGGGLTNTGIAIASFVTIASLILITAILVRVWRRSSKKVDSAPEA